MIAVTAFKYKIFEFVLDHLFTTLKKNLVRPKLEDLPLVSIYTKSSGYDPLLVCKVVYKGKTLQSIMPLETVQDVRAVLGTRFSQEIASLFCHIMLYENHNQTDTSMGTHEIETIERAIEMELDEYFRNSNEKVPENS